MWRKILGIGAVASVGLLAYFSGFFNFLKNTVEPNTETPPLTTEEQTRFHEICSVEKGATLNLEDVGEFIKQNGIAKVVKSGFVNPDIHEFRAQSDLGQLTASPISLIQACNDKHDISTIKTNLKALFEAAVDVKAASVTYTRPNPIISLADDLVSISTEYSELWQNENKVDYFSPVFSDRDAVFLSSNLHQVYESINQNLSNSPFIPNANFVELQEAVERRGPSWQTELSDARNNLPSDIGAHAAIFSVKLYPFIGAENSPIEVSRTISEIGR